MNIQIGTNTLHNTNGIFFAHGQEQIRIEVLEEEQKLALSMSVFMPTGTEAATLHRNVWESNSGDRFVLTENPDRLKVEDTTLNTVVMEIQKGEDQAIVIPKAKFYTSKGTLSEVSGEWWRVGNKMELTGLDADLEGGGIEMPE